MGRTFYLASECLTDARAYPTPYFTVGGSISWYGEAPFTATDGFYGAENQLSENGEYRYYGQTMVTQSSGVCCLPTTTSSPVPQNHYPFPSPTSFGTNPIDPRGWLYILTLDYVYYTGYQNLSSLFAPASINSVLNACHITYPGGIEPSCAEGAAGAVTAAVNPYGGMLPISARLHSAARILTVGIELLTTTVHITSSAPTSSPGPSAEAAQAPQSSPSRTAAAVDPITAGLRASTSSQTAMPNSRTGSLESPSMQSDTALPASDSASPQSLPSSPALAESATAPTSSTLSSAINHAGSVVASLFGFHVTTRITSSYSAESRATSTLASTDTSGLSTPSKTGATPAVQSDTSKPSIASATAAVAPVTTTPITRLAVGTDGSTTNVIQTTPPNILIGSETVAIGSTVSIGGTPVAVMTSGSETYAVMGDSTLALTWSSAPTGPSMASSEDLGSHSTVVGTTLPHAFSIAIGSAQSTVLIVLPGPSSDAPSPLSTQSISPPGAQATASSSSHEPVAIVDGTHTITLPPAGSALTVSGTKYSLATDSAEVVIGSSTEILTTESGLGSYIWYGIGGSSSAGSSSMNGSTSSVLDATATRSSGLAATDVPTDIPVTPQANNGVGRQPSFEAVLGMALMLLVIL